MLLKGGTENKNEAPMNDQQLEQYSKALNDWSNTITAHLAVSDYILKSLLLDRLSSTPNPSQALEDYKDRTIQALIRAHDGAPYKR